jgi:hypothetical protein
LTILLYRWHLSIAVSFFKIFKNGVFAISWYLSLTSTGTVKTVLPTQILKNHFKSPDICFKIAQTIFKKDPQIYFVGEKSPKLAN